MMKKLGTIALLTIVFFIQNSLGQNESLLHVEATYNDSIVKINWIPTNDSIWDIFWKYGYQVTREEIELVDVAMDTIPPNSSNWDNYEKKTVKAAPVFFPKDPNALLNSDTLKLTKAILPKDAAWFDSRGDEKEGYLKMLRYMLYDSIFSDFDYASRNSNIRYQYVVYGVENYPDEMYDFMGMSITDNDIDPSKIYRYTILPVGGSEGVISFELGKKRTFFETNDRYTGVYPDVPLESKNKKPEVYSLEGDAKGYGDSIIVRLAPLQPKALKDSWKMGYKVVKSTVKDNKDIPGTYDKTPVDTFEVFPWTQAQFESYLDSPNPIDSAVFVGAQFMYNSVTNGSENAKEQSEILISMHAYCLYSAEISDIAGEALGLRIVDKDISLGESYLYEVKMPLDSIDANAIGGKAEIFVDNIYEGPEPLKNIEIKEGEFVLDLLIGRENEKHYSLYFFERSDDGGNTFEPIHDLPVAFQLPEEDVDFKHYSRTDSVAFLYKNYIYKIRGKNSFGEYSPWFEISGMAKDKTGTPQPIINEPTHLNATTVEVTWDNQYSETAIDLQGYYVSLSLDNSDELKRVSNLLPKGTSTYNYVHPLPMTTDTMYFFHVQAIDTAGNVATSYSSPVNIIDSIPPPIPVDLTATVNDTTGIVTIIWPQVEAKDLAGYRVYFSNNLNNEFNQITGENQIYNFYQDTIEIKTLSEEIYYKVASIDKRHNLSDFSEVLVVKRPDVVPPVAPVLLQPEPSGNAIQLSWTPSSSIDVEHVFIYRKVEGDTMDWVILDSLMVGQNTFLDSTAAYEQLMAYTLRARDDAGLWSEYALPMKSRRYFDEAIGGVGAVSATFDEKKNNVSIQWDFTTPDIAYLAGQDYRYMVYRAEADGPMQRYRQLRGKDPTYIDKEIEEDKSYRYALMVVFETGKKSTLSEEALVVIPKKEE